MRMKKTSKSIGIDLGTTYTCAAVFQNGTPTVIPTFDGDRTLESLVAFSKDQLIFGNSAKSMLNSKPTAGAANPKRFIGRGFDEPDVAKAIQLLKHNVKRKDNAYDPDKKDNIIYCIDRGLNESEFTQTPIQLSAFILKHVKEYSQKFLGHDVLKAVITVPAHFNDNQRSTTVTAATMAGFEEVKLLNEPTAAAMAYAYKEQQGSTSGEQTVFVFDLGGGTFDVSFLELGDKLEEGSSIAHVVATDGDVFLGGLDFDKVLVDICLDAWKQKHRGNPEMLKIGEKQTRRLLSACEKAKRVLSNAEVAYIDLDCFVEAESFNHRISQAQFDAACKHLRQRCLSIVKRCLLNVALKEKSQLQPRDMSYDSNGILITTPEEDALIRKVASRIDKVLMVGGSSRIPAIHKDLGAFFNNKDLLCHAIHPDEAVAMGASYYAAMLAGDSDMAPEQMICLLETNPFALGIETIHGQMAVIIPQGTTISARKSQIFTTAADNQTAVNIAIYEGNSTLVKNNNLLGQFNLSGIPPAPRGIPQIEVTMEISTDGILKVYAVDKGSSKKSELTVEALGKYTPEEVEKMKANFEKLATEDAKAKERIDALVQLESTFYQMQNSVNEMKISPEAKEKISSEMQKIETWISANQQASVEEIKQKQNELNQIVQKASQEQPETKAPTVEEVE